MRETQPPSYRSPPVPELLFAPHDPIPLPALYAPGVPDPEVIPDDFDYIVAHTKLERLERILHFGMLGPNLELADFLTTADDHLQQFAVTPEDIDRANRYQNRPCVPFCPTFWTDRYDWDPPGHPLARQRSEELARAIAHVSHARRREDHPAVRDDGAPAQGDDQPAPTQARQETARAEKRAPRKAAPAAMPPGRLPRGRDTASWHRRSTILATTTRTKRTAIGGKNFSAITCCLSSLRLRVLPLHFLGRQFVQLRRQMDSEMRFNQV
jgi:hypothetical protein